MERGKKEEMDSKKRDHKRVLRTHTPTDGPGVPLCLTFGMAFALSLSRVVSTGIIVDRRWFVRPGETHKNDGPEDISKKKIKGAPNIYIYI